jgi:hypothetical protein
MPTTRTTRTSAPSAPTIPLADAALRLRRPYLHARDLLFRGVLAGEKRGGRWFVTEASVRAALASQAASQTAAQTAQSAPTAA